MPPLEAGLWADDEVFMDELLNMVESEDVTYELAQTQSH